MMSRMTLLFLLCLSFASFLPGSGVASSAQGALMVKQETFGTMADGKTVELYTLTNSHGIEVRVMTYGGIIVSVKTPDKSGRLADITLGFDSFDTYHTKNPFFGAAVGR
jgi:aldose 1-epimerase